ncbi:MAG: hypothetical protein QME12_07185, partial [Nanoarchaeota archaeon]|nr:hypothetical protein [Nanoarchaeota archaeon]
RGFVQKAQRVFAPDKSGGCADEISGESPKDVCGNECCEPGESKSNCPQDCMGAPMPDEGRFFNQQTGPAYQQRIVEQRVEGVAPMPAEQWREPQPVESTPVQGIEQIPPQEQQATKSAGGGEGVSTAAVVINAIKDLLGR